MAKQKFAKGDLVRKQHDSVFVYIGHGHTFGRLVDRYPNLKLALADIRTRFGRKP